MVLQRCDRAVSVTDDNNTILWAVIPKGSSDFCAIELHFSPEAKRLENPGKKMQKIEKFC
jgi:hypothetical protein